MGTFPRSELILDSLAIFLQIQSPFCSTLGQFFASSKLAKVIGCGTSIILFQRIGVKLLNGKQEYCDPVLVFLFKIKRSYGSTISIWPKILVISAFSQLSKMLSHPTSDARKSYLVILLATDLFSTNTHRGKIVVTKLCTY